LDQGRCRGGKGRIQKKTRKTRPAPLQVGEKLVLETYGEKKGTATAKTRALFSQFKRAAVLSKGASQKREAGKAVSDKPPPGTPKGCKT